MLFKIDSIDFDILSPENIKKMSVIEIINPELYDRDGYPIERGIMDPHLGVIDPGLKCRTCGGRIGTCHGHFGFLELARPVVHVGFSKTIYKLLRATCEQCGRLLASEKEIKNMRDPIQELYLAKKKKCPYCGAEQHNIKFEKPHSFFIDKEPLSPLRIREWFEKISDEDVKLLGLKGGRPEWLILTLFPIPPVTVRPSVTLETGERSEDDLTHKLVDVVRINQRLRDNIDIGAPEFIIDDLWELLQYHVSTFFDNELSGIPPARHRSGRPLRTLSQRLRGKEGRFRQNLSGKRVNFSSRTVVSPDPNISINEVGIPVEIAKELTIPVRVNKKNISYLKSLVKSGPDNWPGANYLIRTDGRKKKITEEDKEEIAKEVDIGSTIERHLQDGDIVLFNRQPSLHRMSIMAHKVKIMPYRTFRLNLCVCSPYNADFDGDEMNLHVPQTEEAMAEARMLLLVQNHIRSPRFGGPIIGCIQDQISGSYLLTKKDTILKEEEANQLLAEIGMDEFVKKEITGRELFSKLLPKDLNIKFESTSGQIVEIRKGKLIRGVIDERAIGEESGLLLDRIEKDYGPDAAREFLDKISRLSVNYLSRKGFTVGLSDADLSSEAEEEIDQLIKDIKKKAGEYIQEYKNGKLEPLPGQNLEESLETYIITTLAEVWDKANEIIERTLPENCAVVMARSGARGSMINLTQTAGCVGQETIQGKRIHRGYKDRTLPHFKRGELSVEAHGFVSSSFKHGLNPFDFFFNSMDGREKLMDTGLRTRRSGYMERRLANALQDLKVEYDMTVRDNRKMIIQFKAAEDGIDPAKSEWGKLDVKSVVESVVS